MKAIRLLTILFTSFSLYAVQTFRPLQAQESAGQNSTSLNSSKTSSSSSSTKLQGKKIELEKSQKYGNEKAGLNINMLLMFSLILLVPTFAMSCMDKMDTYIFGATALFYVAAELLNFKKFKRQSKREMEAYETGSKTGNQTQQKSLTLAASETNAAAKAAEKRASLAKTASMGFMSASAIALVMAIMQTASGDMYACSKGLMGSTEQDYLSGKEQMITINSLDFNYLQKYTEGADNDLSFLHRQVEVSRIQKGATSSMTLKESNNIHFYFEEAKTESNFVTAFKNIGPKIVNLFFPKAEASKLAALGLGGLGSLAVFKAFSKTTSTSLKTGYTRAGLYMVMYAIANKVAADSQSAADSLKKRSFQYKELAAKLGAQGYIAANVNKRDTTFEIGALETKALQQSDSDLKDKDSLCFTGSRLKLVDNPGCSCKATGKCKKSVATKIKMANIKVPKAITSSISTLGAAASSVFSGDLEGATANTKSVAKNIARLRKITAGLKAKASSAFKGGIDFDKLESSTRRRLTKAANRGYNNLSASEKGAFASRFPAVFGKEAAKKGPNTDIKVGDTKVNTGAITAKAIRKSRSYSKGDSLANFSFAEEEEVTENTTFTEGPSMGKASDPDQGEERSDDIDGDRNKNIFSLITKRYFKSAYPSFFTTKE